jgi:hypothetical protein
MHSRKRKCDSLPPSTSTKPNDAKPTFTLEQKDTSAVSVADRKSGISKAEKRKLIKANKKSNALTSVPPDKSKSAVISEKKSSQCLPSKEVKHPKKEKKAGDAEVKNNGIDDIFSDIRKKGPTGFLSSFSFFPLFHFIYFSQCLF